MSNLIVNAPENKSIPPIEAGAYAAICTSIIDLGEQYNKTFNNVSRKVLFQWEIPDEQIEIDGEMKPRVISETYTASLGEKATLRKTLESWRGRQFTQEELAAFDLENVLGAPCMLNIIHVENANGNTFAKVAAIARLPKGYPAIEATGNLVVFSLDDSDALERIETFPEWIQKRIKESATFERMNNEFKDIGSDDIPF